MVRQEGIPDGRVEKTEVELTLFAGRSIEARAVNRSSCAVQNERGGQGDIGKGKHDSAQQHDSA